MKVTLERLLISVRETSEMLSLGRTKIYELIRDERLLAVKVGRRTLILLSSVRAVAELPDETWVSAGRLETLAAPTQPCCTRGTGKQHPSPKDKAGPATRRTASKAIAKRLGASRSVVPVTLFPAPCPDEVFRMDCLWHGLGPAPGVVVLCLLYSNPHHAMMRAKRRKEQVKGLNRVVTTDIRRAFFGRPKIRRRQATHLPRTTIPPPTKTGEGRET